MTVPFLGFSVAAAGLPVMLNTQASLQKTVTLSTAFFYGHKLLELGTAVPLVDSTSADVVQYENKKSVHCRANLGMDNSFMERT